MKTKIAGLLHTWSVWNLDGKIYAI